MFNPVASYRYLLPNLYVSVADIANPDLLACGSRTWISLDIARFYEEHCQPSSVSAWPASPKKRCRLEPGVCLHRFCLNMKVVWGYCLFYVGPGYDGFLRGVIYGEWYDVCDFVVLSIVEVCVYNGGVNVFHVCLNLCIVYDVGVCVNVYGVVCVVVCCLFPTYVYELLSISPFFRFLLIESL